MAIAVEEGIGSPGDAWLDGEEEEMASRVRFSRSYLEQFTLKFFPEVFLAGQSTSQSPD